MALDCQSLALALDCRSFAFALGSTSLVLALGYQSLAFTLDCQSLALASNYQALALEVVLDIGVEQSNFLAINPSSPMFILTSFKKYLDFIPEQSCSDGSVDSWKVVQQEADVQVLHHLLEEIICSTATSALSERVFSHSRLFMRPHRAIMGDRMLSNFVLLK